MEALLIASGDVDSHILKEEARDKDYIIAVDGGMNYCFREGVNPDLIIGDLDSISLENKRLIEGGQIELLRFPTEKNATDLELAIDYVIEHQFTKVTILGGTGSRLDHSMAGIFLLVKLKEAKVEGFLINNKNIIFLQEGRKEVFALKKYMSIIPISNKGIIVSLEKFKYPLNQDYIDFGSTRCISNEFLGDYGIIDIEKGCGIVILSED